ncbi:MAG: aminotransferase class IV [Gemmatimonadota bacterium]
MNPALCWARGVLRPITEFRPRAGDRAFRYGDGVFATMALERGRLLDAAAHADRLVRSADAIGLSVPEAVRSPGRLCEILALLGASGSADGVVRVQVSAESGGRGYGRAGDASWELVEIHPLPAPRVLTVAVLEPVDAPVPALPSVKSCSALAHVLCARAAARRGVAEAVRVAGGHVLEASASNLFWIHDGALCTPSSSLPLYPGVTRSVVLDVARGAGWEIREGEFDRAALARAGSAFLTNAVRGVEPVAELEGSPLEWPPELEALRESVQAARIEGGLPVPS